MNRPKRQPFNPAYHWCDVQDYIEFKYGIKLRDYKREPDEKYRDFWHFIVDRCSPHRGSFIHLPEDVGGAESWQREILSLILTEFPELATEAIWVDW